MTASTPLNSTSPFTTLSADEELRLWPLAVHARYLQERLRYVDYRQAELDASLLAAKLLEHYTISELRQATFVGVPRGGLLVLGLLAYQLNLKPKQLLTNALPEADLICLVDDCALSGLLLNRTLSSPSYENGRIVVALLYATSGLRAAVQAHYPQVELCITAHDLAERDRKQELSAQEATLQNVIEGTLQLYMDGQLYPGPAELVGFAWNEPNFYILTPFDDQPDHQWRFLPPHKCLKNRQALGLPPGKQRDLEWVVPNNVVYGWFEGTLYLLATHREEVFRLDDLAADCWRAVAGYGSFAAALSFLREKHGGSSAADLARQLTNHLAIFKEKQLLRPLQSG